MKYLINCFSQMSLTVIKIRVNLIFKIIPKEKHIMSSSHVIVLATLRDINCYFRVEEKLDVRTHKQWLQIVMWRNPTTVCKISMSSEVIRQQCSSVIKGKFSLVVNFPKKNYYWDSNKQRCLTYLFYIFWKLYAVVALRSLGP